MFVSIKSRRLMVTWLDGYSSFSTFFFSFDLYKALVHMWPRTANKTAQKIVHLIGAHPLMIHHPISSHKKDR